METPRVQSGAQRVLTTVFSLGVLLSLSCSRSATSDPQATLYLAAVERAKGLDPAFADDQYSGEQVAKGYEGLLEYHYLKRPYVMQPLLAESMPEVSADGLTYRFRIRKGVRFHDDPCFKATEGKGRELTAADFVYSWLRLADPKTRATNWWILEGKILGLDEWRAAAQASGTADYSASVAGLQAPDPFTLQIRLVKPSNQFLYYLAMPGTVALPSEAVDRYGADLGQHVVGTGPFRLTEFKPAQRIIWDRNTSYRPVVYPSEGEKGDREAGLLADAGKPLPLVDRVVTTVHVESQPMWLSFLSGKLDLTPIPKDNFAAAITPAKELTSELRTKGIRLIKSSVPDLTYEGMKYDDPVLGKNKHLRQALSLAIDVGPMIELFYNGRAIPAQSPIPPGVDGYDPKFVNPYRISNVARAKALLAKAGYPDGRGLAPIEYYGTASTVSRQMSEYIKKSLEQIGVTIKITELSWTEFSASIKNRKAQLWGIAWHGDYPDPENFLMLFYSKNVPPGPNGPGYANPEYDRLYEALLAARSQSARAGLYRKMRDLLVEDAPVIWGVHRLGYALVQPWLKNYKPHAFANSITKYARTERSAKGASR